MTVASVYRRQDMMREICRRIGYQGRFVWLVSSLEVPIMASQFTGQSRLRFRLLNITEPPYSFHKFTPRDSKRVKLDPNTALCALPTLRGRRRDLLTFLCPRRVSERTWSIVAGDKLSPEEIAVLLHEDNFDDNTMTVARAVCVYRGLVDPRGRVTERGARLLDGKQIYRKI